MRPCDRIGTMSHVTGVSYNHRVRMLDGEHKSGVKLERGIQRILNGGEVGLEEGVLRWFA